MSIVNRSQIDTVFTQKYKNNKFEVVGPIDWDYFNVINKITKQLHEIYLTADDTMTEVNKNDRIKFTERIFEFVPSRRRIFLCEFRL